MANSQTVVNVLPGVDLFTHSRSRFVHCRVWDKKSQKYCKRTTGKTTFEEARQWTLENLSELFQIQITERGGGTNSISRHLVNHIEYHRKRLEAGEISQATFACYEGIAKHFFVWFRKNGFKRIADIKRTSFLEYALNRTTVDGYSRSTVNNEVMFLRMWWRWLQEREIVSRPLNIPKLKTAINLNIAGEPFEKGHLNKIYNQINEFVSDNESQVSLYNRLLFSLYIQLLDESGARQHEVHNLKWSNIRVGETASIRKRIINAMAVPHASKRGYRQSVFRGSSFVKIMELQSNFIGDTDKDDYLFRNQADNSVIDRSTFRRYWCQIMKTINLSYTFHTFRAHRITQLIMSGVETELVARNLGLSPAQISKTYLRFAPAGHFEKLIQKDVEADDELRMIINRI